MDISTWKLICPCPKCGKKYLLATIKASMIIKSNFGLLNKWRFRELPDGVYCEDCGSIKHEDVICEYPIRGIPVGSNRLLMTLSFVVICLILFIIIMSKLFVQ